MRETDLDVWDPLPCALADALEDEVVEEDGDLVCAEEALGVLVWGGLPQEDW